VQVLDGVTPRPAVKQEEAADPTHRALRLLAQRDATSISSHRLRDDGDEGDEVSAAQQEALLTLPRGRWPRKHSDTNLVRRGWLGVANSLIALRTRGHHAWLADLRAAFAVRAVHLSVAEAQLLLPFLVAPESFTGHALASVLELSLYAVPPLVKAVPLLAEARLLLPSADDLVAKSLFPASLGGFEVRREQLRPDRLRACKHCGAAHLGDWSSHTCTVAAGTKTIQRPPPKK
jgi:hypothetical protein